MNILMLSDVYFPRVNGVSTSIRTAAQWLVRNGHRVTLVAPDYGPQSDQARYDAELGEQFRVLRLPARQIFFDPEDRLIKAPAIRRILPLLAKRPLDAIHIHTPFRAHQLGMRMARSSGVPVVETYHTHFEDYAAHYLPWFPQTWLRWVSRRASRVLYDAVDHLIVPTAEMSAVLQSYGIQTHSTVLPTGVDLTEFVAGDGAAFRARHGIAVERPVLVTISRLAVEKNITFLLQMARVLIQDFPELLFVIAGEGPDAPRLHALAHTLGLERNVLFLGNLDRTTELPACYRAADVFVFASPTETQGLVLIEAMAVGVPIVSTAVLGTAAVLRHANGAIVSPQDVRAFAHCVAGVLRDRDLRESLAASSLRDAQAWSSEDLMKQAMALYAGLSLSRSAGCGAAMPS